jgi:hypothetical protein
MIREHVLFFHKVNFEHIRYYTVVDRETGEIRIEEGAE